MSRDNADVLIPFKVVLDQTIRSNMISEVIKCLLYARGQIPWYVKEIEGSNGINFSSLVCIWKWYVLFNNTRSNKIKQMKNIHVKGL